MNTKTQVRAAIFLTHPQVGCWNFTDADARCFRRHFPGIEPCVCRSPAEFLEALPTATLALVWRFRQEWFARAPRLRILSTPAAGRDYFRVVPPEGVTLLYGRFHGVLIGETVLGALLAMTRGILPAATLLAEIPWPRAELDARLRPLRGSHAVILGFGRIGAWIGRLLKGFGVRLTGIRRRVAAAPDYFSPEDRVLPVDRLDEVLPETDHLVLCLPGGPETDHIMDERRLALLPPHATLCNVGRGNALDEAALVQALSRKRLAGALLDVFSREPLPADSPLRRTPNLWRLPHAAAIAPNYMTLYIEDLARQLPAR